MLRWYDAAPMDERSDCVSERWVGRNTAVTGVSQPIYEYLKAAHTHLARMYRFSCRWTPIFLKMDRWDALR